MILWWLILYLGVWCMSICTHFYLCVECGHEHNAVDVWRSQNNLQVLPCLSSLSETVSWPQCKGQASPWAYGDPPVSTPISPEGQLVLLVCAVHPAVTWALGIWTEVMSLTGRHFYPVSHLPILTIHSSNFIFSTFHVYSMFFNFIF